MGRTVSVRRSAFQQLHARTTGTGIRASRITDRQRVGRSGLRHRRARPVTGACARCATVRRGPLRWRDRDRTPQNPRVGARARGHVLGRRVLGHRSVDGRHRCGGEHRCAPFAPDVDAALIEVRRILRPGWRLVFTTREPSTGTPHYERLGPAWGTALVRNGFTVANVVHRQGVSSLWRRLFDQWLEYEEALRDELAGETVDRLITDARDTGPRLDDGRP